MITVTVVHRKARHDVQVDPACPLADFRTRVQEVTGVAPDHQQLYISGRPRISGSAGTLQDVGVQDGGKVFLVGADPEQGKSVAAAPARRTPAAVAQPLDAVVVLVGGRVWGCSYPLGPVRQHLFRCLTCERANQPAAVCLGCMEVCHRGHQVEELYTKRNFQCDCGTDRLALPACHFSTTPRAAQPANQYGPNFAGTYCHCNGAYDREVDEMIQCWVCADWFHDRCTGLPVGEMEDPLLGRIFLCRRCLARHPFLRRYGRCCSEGTPISGGPPALLAEARPPADPQPAALPTPVPPLGVVSDSTATTRSPMEVAGVEAGVEAGDEARDLLLPEVEAGWCRCDRCLALYERSGLSFIFKAELDEDLTRACTVSGDSDSDSDDEEVTDAEEPQSKSVASQMMAGMAPIDQSHFANGLRDLHTSFGDWLGSMPPGEIITDAHVAQFRAQMEERRSAKRKRDEME
eukprot:EG_transcript_9943